MYSDPIVLACNISDISVAVLPNIIFFVLLDKIYIRYGLHNSRYDDSSSCFFKLRPNFNLISDASTRKVTQKMRKRSLAL